jgi:hypothetical protein
MEFGDCGGGVFKRPAQGIGDFAGNMLVEFEGRRGWLRIGEPSEGGGGWGFSFGGGAVGGVYFGEGVHAGKYTTGCGVAAVMLQPMVF